MHTRNVRLVRGFTLVELMVTMVIVALLLTVAVPTYQSQIRKSRRTEAKTAVLDIAGREERLYSVNNAYSSAASDLGYAASGVNWNAVNIGNGYYQASVTATATTFTVTATAFSTDQLKDTACKTYTVNEMGVQGATDSTGATSATITATCWR